MKHYHTVILSEALYASECIIINILGITDKLENQERNDIEEDIATSQGRKPIQKMTQSEDLQIH